jgi:hypothetical protein
MLSSDITDDAGLGQSANWAYVTGENKPADNADVTATSNFVVTTYPNDKNVLQTQIDGKIQTWFQESDPNDWSYTDRLKHDGDYWFNSTTEINELRCYNAATNTWELVRDQRAVDAYYNAISAQDQALFTPKVSWATPDDFSALTITGGTLVSSGEYVTVSSSSGTVLLTQEGLSIDGSRYSRIGLRLLYDSTKNMRVRVRYKTYAHGFSDSYLSEGFYYDDLWHTVTVDMSDLVYGGDDYITSTITGLQIEITYCDVLTTEMSADFGFDSHDFITDELTFYDTSIAWIAIGALTVDILKERDVSDGADVTGENTSADTASLNGINTTTLFGNLVPSGTGLFIDGTHLGYHDEDTWKTYMDSSGNFYLSGTGTQGLSWNGSTLNINGNISVQNPSDVRTALNVSDGADVTGDNTSSDTNALNGLLTSNLFGASAPASSGLFIDGTHLGYHESGVWKTYMDNTGNFYLSGSGTHSLTWDGEDLTISGNITVKNPSTVRAALNVEDGADKTSLNTAASISGQGALATLSSVSNTYITSVSGDKISTGTITVNNTVGMRVQSSGDIIFADSTNVDYVKMRSWGASGTYARGMMIEPITDGTGNFAVGKFNSTELRGDSIDLTSFDYDINLSAGNWKYATESYFDKNLVIKANRTHIQYGYLQVDNYINGINYADSNVTHYWQFDWTGSKFIVNINNVGGVLSTSWFTLLDISDIRIKDNIQNINFTWTSLDNIHGIHFNYNNSAKREIGLIAQDVLKEYPEVIFETPEGYYGIYYEKLVPVLLEAVKNLNTRLKTIEEA